MVREEERERGRGRGEERGRRERGDARKSHHHCVAAA
jgi:hypothetical protein